MNDPDPTAPLLAAWAALVVKEGVHLGLLAPGQRALALALAWSALPAGRVIDERAVNALLQAHLAGPLRFMATDHVELRRWLVDTGWLTRDGFGRAYRRAEPDALPTDRRPLASALDGLDVAAWVRAQREQKAEERARRHAAWAARKQGVA